MKKTLLLSTALATGLLATAQTGKINQLMKHNNEQHINFINSLLRIQQGATAQKPTGTAQRVIAQVYNETGYSDSTRFKYTGTRGSRYDHNTINFGYNLEYGSNYAPMIAGPYQYSPLDMLADSISAYEDTELYQFSNGFYRSDNKLDSFALNYLNGSDPADVQKTFHSFYPGGYLKEAVTLSSNGSSFDTTQVRRLSYNGAYDKVAADTTFANFGGGLTPFLALDYHYNAQGNADTVTSSYFTGSVFEPTEKSIVSYTSSGKIQKISVYMLNSGNQYQIFQSDSLAYANNADYFTFWESNSFDQDGLVDFGSRMVKYPGTNGLPDSLTMLSLNNNVWEEDITLHYTYNNFDNPETLTATTGGVPEEGMITFYYETYEDGTSGINPIASNKDFIVYPNPFSNNINIDWKGKQQNNVTIRLTNIVGQEVYKTSMKLTAGRNAISIPALNNGNYILLIQDADGKSWSSKMVKK
jgi:hypothetical protein